MKRTWMCGAVLVLASLQAAAQGLDLPDPAAVKKDDKATESKKDAKKAEKAAADKGDPLALPDMKLAPAKDEKKDAKKAEPKGDSLALPDLKPVEKKAEAKKDALSDLMDAPPKKDDKAKDAKKDAKKDDLAGLDSLTEKKDAAKEAKDKAAGQPTTATITKPPATGATAGASGSTPGASGSTSSTKIITAVPADTKDKAGSAPPATGGVASVQAPAPGGKTEKGPWWVEIKAGAERGSERYIEGDTSLTHLGAAGAWNFYGNWQMIGNFDFRSSTQGYVINTPSSNGQARPPSQLDEQRYDGRLGVGFDTGPKIAESGRLMLMPTLAVNFLSLQNSAFPTSFFGLEAGLQASWELSRAVIIKGSIDYAFNFAESTTQSAVGAPKGHVGATAGLVLPLEGGYALSLNYVGDFLAFRNVYRVANGGALGFSTTF
ncbi:MAG: hypothetical protein JST92_10200 [Deltaproteobacteria bacterium]|nr:hypothetical protein [Deltaproteobacteria bacterium]